MVSGVTVSGSYAQGVTTQAGANSIITSTRVQDVVFGYGVVCSGSCLFSQGAITNSGRVGLYCGGAQCGVYLTYFERNDLRDISVVRAGKLTEYHSCPHDIHLSDGSSALLIEPATCGSIDCLNDGTGTYTGTTSVCQ